MYIKQYRNFENIIFDEVWLLLSNDHYKIYRLAKRGDIFVSKNNEETEIDRSLLKEKAELNLCHNYENIYPRTREFIFKKEYKKVFKLLGDLCEPVDKFFDQVLVMDKDNNIRKNRVALIKKIGILFNQVADLSKIVSTKERRE